MELEYRSKRQGLAPMVVGLLHGLGRRFRTPVAVEQTASRERGDGQDLFRIHYDPSAGGEAPSEP